MIKKEVLTFFKAITIIQFNLHCIYIHNDGITRLLKCYLDPASIITYLHIIHCWPRNTEIFPHFHAVYSYSHKNSWWPRGIIHSSTNRSRKWPRRPTRRSFRTDFSLWVKFFDALQQLRKEIPHHVSLLTRANKKRAQVVFPWQERRSILCQLMPVNRSRMEHVCIVIFREGQKALRESKGGAAYRYVGEKIPDVSWKPGGKMGERKVALVLVAASNS